MFEIKYGDDGKIVISGRFDASQAEKAQEFLAAVTEPTVVDLKDLAYISSAGLATLLWTQKRLMESGSGLKLINVSHHINDVFRFTGFYHIFEIETRGAD
jgi:anti-sigma B factor antagonist